MDIQLLPPEVAGKIAAGEVVERPASVVKELVENALDAGATEVRIEVREGGQRLIRVADDGHGIPADQASLSFTRHATSKLRSIEDLDEIATLGFRGEALYSIAAVARVTMLTRAAGEEVGTLVKLEGSANLHLEPRATPQGTIITVENLFFNVPARRKFLRSTGTEIRHISNVVTHYALAFPECRFTLVSDGRLTFQTTGSGKMEDVLVKLLGVETAKQMLPVVGEEMAAPTRDGIIHVQGVTSNLPLHRANRSQIRLFVNRRWIQDRNLVYAIIQAYHTLLPGGRYPVAFIFIQMDPTALDVNVHPTKAEVRFRDGNTVFRAVQKSVRRALVEHAPVSTFSPSPSPEAARRQHLFHPTHPNGKASQMALDMHRPAETAAPLFPTPGNTVDETEVAPERSPTTPPAEGDPSRLPPLRVLGQIAQMYIIAEGPEGMILIDQHAAHERVLFDRLMAERAAMEVASQSLLEPAAVELSLAQSSVVKEVSPALADLGFEVEPFGGQTWLVRAIPAILSHMDPPRALLDVLDGYESGEDAVGQAVEARVALLVCKQGAVKGGQNLSMSEMQALIEQLEASTSPRTCPHGRPTMLHVSADQLEREFGRR